MNFEDEIFKKYNVDYEKLIKYGFIKENDNYKYSKEFMDSSFRTDIYITNSGEIKGKVIDLSFNEEYINFRIEEQIGQFVGQVRNEYKNILLDIRNNCFVMNYFIYEQANRIEKLINEKYNVIPEFLWETAPNYGVFRNARSNKWFAIIMNIDKSKIIPEETGEIEVLNVKIDNDVQKYLKIKGIYPSYHMSKKSWVSIILDNILSDEEIMKLIDISFNISNIKGEWIVPANPKYYDIINAFNDTDTIIWKQSNNILVGDTIYLYVAEPISAIMYKCEVLEVDIPYKYEDKNLSIKKVMKIKLLKRYEKDKFTFKKLNEYGIKAIRGARNLTNELREELNNFKRC